MTPVIAKTVKYVTLVIGSIVALLPLTVILLASVKTQQELEQGGPFDFPSSPQWGNYATFFVRGRALEGFMNTGIILVFSILGTIVIGTMAAYAIDRFEFRFRKSIVMLFLLATLVPGVTTQVATFQVVHALGAYNTRVAPILLFMGTDIISIYIFIQFMRGIPIVVIPTLIIFLLLQRQIYNGLTQGPVQLLHRALGEAVVDLALQQQEDDQRGNDDDDDAGRDDLPRRRIRPLEPEERGGDHRQVPARHVQERDVELVVDRDALDDDHGRDRRLEQREDDAAVDPPVVRAVQEGRLVQLLGDAAHELDEDVDRDDVRSHEQQDRRHPGVVGTQRVHDLEGRDLGGDAGYQRGQQEEHHDALPEPELEPVDRVRGHGADDDGPEDREHQDDPGVHEALEGPAPDEERRVVAPLGGAREVERTALLELLLRLDRRQQDHRERQQRNDAPDDQRDVLDGLGDDGGHARFTFSSGMIRRWIQVTISTINSRITAMAVILLLIVLIVTWIQRRLRPDEKVNLA